MMKTKLLGGLLLLSFALSGCSKQVTTTNVAPSVIGVKDFQCVVNTTVDFLDGVAALDKEDGDITPNLEIIITPHVDVVDGFATFSKPGEYSVIYKVKDSEGRSVQKRSYVDVVSRDFYSDFSTPGEFYGVENGTGHLEKCGMVNNEFILKASGQSASEDIMLCRKFNLQTNTQYTFKYKVDSHSVGKVVALANGRECAETELIEGESTLSFDHIEIDKENTSKEVEIALCFGDIANLDLKILGVRYEYPQEAGKVIDLTKEYSFFGRVYSRIEGTGRGNARANDDGESATLVITQEAEELYLGGMFIDTGAYVKEGVSYKVSFDVEASVEEGFEVIIQRDRWNEKWIEGVYDAKNGHYERTFVPSEAQQGSLWLYVQSGKTLNTVTISNLKVEETLNPYGFETIRIEDYSEYHNEDYPTTLKTDSGSFTYTINKFCDVDHDQQVTSPKFYINGSSGNYVLSFKAKASKPVEMAVAAPLPGGWEPNLLYHRVNLSEVENTYTFFFNTLAADIDYVIVWQFGFASNQNYQDVVIDISEVTIEYRNVELDG